MSEREMTMAEGSVPLEYTQTAYPSSIYEDNSLNAVSESTAFPASNAEEQYTSYDAELGGGSNNVPPAEDSSVAARYDSTENGKLGSGAAGGTPTENVMVESIAGSGGEDSGVSEEEDRLWTIVRTNSLDFDAWTALIDETEKTAGEKIWKIRKVYDEFLAEFPLCYGYWKKYADHEARLGSMDKVVEVYERAVLGVTYSVDIWLHYCTFCISTYGDADTIRRLFERAFQYVGTDYLSFPLWDKYIEYEEIQSEWSNVAMIYTRILDIPNRRLDDYLLRFKALAASRPLSELKTAEELVTSLPETQHHTEQEKETVTQSEESEQAVKLVSSGSSETVEFEKYVSIREEIYAKAKEFDSKICDFENAIRRPYFHVRPLNIAELENWHSYLTFIEREGDINKVVKLYERCLVACANYPDFWVRYVLCMETCQNMDIANNALARATQVFVKRQPEIHLFAARFREKSDDISGARAAYQLIHTQIAPGLLDAIVKHANMEHRVGNSKDAFSLYEQAIAIEKGKENSQTLPILYAQYSRFSLLVCGNMEKAREILSEAVENVHLSKPLLETIMLFESIHSRDKRTDYIDSLVEKFIAPSSENIHFSTMAEREELSYIFLEFLDMFGDAPSIARAEDRHARLFLPHRSRSEIRKRHADDYLASDKSKLAKSYDASALGQSFMGSYPSAQGQWQAGYGLQSPAWPPSAQASSQPTAYVQQAAYGAYGYQQTYPQGGGYGYQPAYPAHPGLPQPSYPQPTGAATAAVAPVQQPAAVSQPYYGSYY